MSTKVMTDNSSAVSWLVSGFVALCGFITENWAGLVGAFGVLSTLAMNLHYKRREDIRRDAELRHKGVDVDYDGHEESNTHGD